MALVELIATPTTKPEILDQLEAFVTTALGKSVVRAKDTPNFIANRVGIAGMLATIKEAENFGLSYDVVDDLTGKKLGRASSAAPSAPPTWSASTRWRTSSRRCRTTSADRTIRSTRPTRRRRCSPADRAGRAGPEERRRLLQEGRQGHPAARPGEGRLRRRRRQGRRDRRAHPEEAAGRAPEAAARIEEPAGAVPLGDPARQLPLRRGAPGRHRRERARHRLRDALGLRHAARARSSSGRQAGWTQVAAWIKEDIDAGKALSSAPLPAWVFEGPVAATAACTAPKARGARRTRATSRAQHAAGLPAPALPRDACSAPARRRRSKSRHRGVPQRRGARLDARRRGADRQHHRQAAPDQPGA